MSDRASVPAGRARPPSFSLRRVGAMVTRYTYLLRSSWARVVDLIYWPALQMITWGFLQTYLARFPTRAQAAPARWPPER